MTESDDKKSAPTWPRVFRLSVPIKFGSELIEEIVLRRGQFGDTEGVELTKITFGDLAMVASKMSGQPLAVIRKLDAEDSGPIMEVVTAFLGKSLSTGGTQ